VKIKCSLHSAQNEHGFGAELYHSVSGIVFLVCQTRGDVFFLIHMKVLCKFLYNVLFIMHSILVELKIQCSSCLYIRGLVVKKN
jgi:hypothetical protein